MSRHVVVTACSLAATAGLLWLLLAPGPGLLHAGPWTCMALVLIGLGLARQAAPDGADHAPAEAHAAPTHPPAARGG